MAGGNSSNSTGNNSSVSYATSILGISGVSCSLSIVGAIIIFGTYFVVPSIRNTTRKLFTFLTVADFLSALGYLSSVIFYEVKTDEQQYLQFCTFQSAVTTYGSIASFYFTVVIALHLFYAVYSQSSSSDRARTFNIVCTVCWIVPGVIVAQALSYDKLGRVEDTQTTGPWCWVKCSTCNDTSSIVYMLVTGKFWEILAYVSTIALYGLLKRQLVMRHETRSFCEISADLRDEDKNFLYVWAVFIAIRISGTIRFFLNMWPKEANSSVDTFLQYIQAFGDPSQAFFNCIIFCLLDKSVRTYFYRKFRRISPEEFEEVETENGLNDPIAPLHRGYIHDSRDRSPCRKGMIDAGPTNKKGAKSGLNKSTQKSYGACSPNVI